MAEHATAEPRHDLSRRRRDRGTTLIEVLVSIVLLGIAGVAVLTALRVSIIGATTHDEVAQNQAVLTEAADLMTDTEPERVVYTPCTGGTTAAYQSAIDAQFPPAGTIAVSVRYWDRTGSGGFGTTCRFGAGDRLQEITLTSTVKDVTREVVVVKRPIAVPTQDTVPAPPVPPFTGGSGQATVSLTPGINGP